MSALTLSQSLAPEIAERAARTRDAIADACARVGRDPEKLTVVAVAKTRSAAEVEAAIEAGLAEIGENRVQEAAAKVPQVGRPARWHLVGHLQTNKARDAVRLFDVVQSVDSPRVARALDRCALARDRQLEVFLEVNTSGEAAKFGVEPARARVLLETVLAYEHLLVTGLMTIGPLTDDERLTRLAFATLRELFEAFSALRHPRLAWRHLSMGMSGDFPLAIAEGATMLRLGTTLFGLRPE
jgi:pyridoxal phosphate enzyme (YggS family)